jgi:hypothetical protein
MALDHDTVCTTPWGGVLGTFKLITMLQVWSGLTGRCRLLSSD